jgi:uncharacterized repeat protein (TIGR03803 family)
LVLSSNRLYGTTGVGGTGGSGTVFAVNTDGTDFAVLHNFSRLLNNGRFNDEGANPGGGLVLSGNILYGTARHGGSGGVGTIFAMNTDGTGFTVLYTFTEPDGAEPAAGLDSTS